VFVCDFASVVVGSCNLLPLIFMDFFFNNVLLKVIYNKLFMVLLANVSELYGADFLKG
jgi:hypothetical protein